jgi:hypothetical protein
MFPERFVLERLLKEGILISMMFVLTASGRLGAEPFNIVIITDHNSPSEQRYTGFLQEIYGGNVLVKTDADRYKEFLSEEEKGELVSADLIIVSRDADSKDYNGDAHYWNDLGVPILNHNIKLARSREHDFWDWLPGDSNSCDPCTHVAVADPNDPIFDGIDTSGGTVQMFLAGAEVDHSDQGSAGNGKVVATSGGKVVIARWLGTEALYHGGSVYGPGGARVFFATPEKMSEFFEDGTDDAKLMLRNAILSLLSVERPAGDIDGDGDVDFDDFAVFSEYWGTSGCTESLPCGIADLTGDGAAGAADLWILARDWLEGADVTAPEPNVTTWLREPRSTSAASLCMAATATFDAMYGVEYYFACTSGNGPDSLWQYSNVFEPNGLASRTKYTYRAKARDTSGNLNETEWSVPATARTFGVHSGIADASAGAAISENLFIVGGDEGNRLCIYEFDNSGSGPFADVNISDSLNVDPCHPETDIEGATWLNGRIFWITSHGRNKDGEYRYGRYQFFATSVTIEGGTVTVTVDGNYSKLAEDLIAYDGVYNLGLADSIGVLGGGVDPNEIADLAPKKDGLNIEGLCTAADGNTVLIGFRNPRPEIDGSKMALIIPLGNAEAVVLEGASAQLGPPILLDLGGLGIRSIEYSPMLGEYLLIAGSHKSGDEKPVQILYSLEMGSGIVTKLEEFPIITPEGLFQFPLSSDVELLSDDGILLIETPEGRVYNKLLPREQRTFRTQTISP